MRKIGVLLDLIGCACIVALPFVVLADGLGEILDGAYWSGGWSAGVGLYTLVWMIVVIFRDHPRWRKIEQSGMLE